MCGVFGIFEFKGTNSCVNQQDLEAGIQSLVHRGPDNFGYFINNKRDVGLAHARLSIIDLSTGQQPLQTTDGQITAVVNGEFYDFKEIRQELKAKGHIFKTNSDSEIAIHLYREYGLSFVNYLRGEFAFILFDAKLNRLIAVRDRFGVKPLHYAFDEKTQKIYIASEAKAILAQDGMDAYWDEDAFFNACNMQYLQPNRTLFDGIFQIEPGQMLICDKDQAPVFKQYWDMDYAETAQDISFDEAVSKTKEVLEDAVKTRMVADTPVCYHLSGGIDSSSIAGIAAKNSDKEIDCFTVRFEDQTASGYDEYDVALRQANLIGANLHEVPVSSRQIVDTIDEAILKTEGLAINGHFAGKYLLNKAIKNAGFKVALSGEGSDEVFMGYPHFKQDLLKLGGGDVSKADLGNEKLKGVFLKDGDALDVTMVEKLLGAVPSFFDAKASLGFRMTGLLNDGFARKQARDVYADFINHFDVKGQLQGRHIINQASYLWSKSALSNYILKTLGDGCEMAHSIEGRVPFLDHKLFETVKDFPLSYKLHEEGNGQLIEKHVLREAMKSYLTPELYQRQKHPFIAPPVAQNSARDYLFEKLNDLVQSQNFKDQPFFDQAKVLSFCERLQKSDLKFQVSSEPIVMMLITSLSAMTQFKMKTKKDLTYKTAA